MPQSIANKKLHRTTFNYYAAEKMGCTPEKDIISELQIDQPEGESLKERIKESKSKQRKKESQRVRASLALGSMLL